MSKLPIAFSNPSLPTPQPLHTFSALATIFCAMSKLLLASSSCAAVIQMDCSVGSALRALFSTYAEGAGWGSW